MSVLTLLQMVPTIMAKERLEQVLKRTSIVSIARTQLVAITTMTVRLALMQWRLGLMLKQLGIAL